MKKIICLSVICYSLLCMGQSSLPKEYQPFGPQPEIGKPMPDFTLYKITHYKRNKASLKDFKGKWLFLDFWGVTCTACIKSFPKLDSLQNEFKDQIQIVLVGLNSKMMNAGYEKKIEPLYEKLREKYNLNLASSYDSALSFRWGIYGWPYIIIVDPQGVVRGLTRNTNSDLSRSNIQNLINGNSVSFSDYGIDSYPEYDISKFPGSETDKVVFRSILTRGNGERSAVTDFRNYARLRPEDRKDGFIIVMQPLFKLYFIAYAGKTGWGDLARDMIYPHPVIEVSDSSLFQYDYYSKDFKGLYNYNLANNTVQHQDFEYIKKIFQQELKNAFGFEAALEKRKMTVWELIASPEAAEKLKTKGGKSSYGGIPHVAWSLTNYPVRQLVDEIWNYHQNGLPIFDETGITHNIDITMDAVMQDIEDVKKALQKNGLDLVKREREMKVLVIRDPTGGN